MSPLQIAFISSGLTLSGVLLAAVIAGVYNLRAKQNEYVNDYYKTVIQRRIDAYEHLERLIIDLRTSVLDKDNKPYHRLFSIGNASESAFKRLFSVMSQAMWLSDEAFTKTRDLNYLLFGLGTGSEGDPVEFAKQNYRAIAELREALEKILAADMLELHKVRRFLKQKKRKKTSAFLPVQITKQGLQIDK